MIELNHFYAKTIQEAVDVILDIYKGKGIKVFIPKQTVQFNSSDQEIAYDYARIGFCIEKLNSVGDKLKFDNVTVEKNESVGVSINFSDLEKVAEEILHLSALFGNDLEDAEDIEFDLNQEMLQFLDETKNGKLKPTAVFYTDIHFEYYEMADD